MIPRFTGLLLVLLISHSSIAQDIDTNILKAQTREMTEAFMKTDYKKFVSYTYPGVVRMMGGEDKMVSFLSQQVEAWKEQGYSFRSLTTSLTSLKAKAGKEIHCIVSQYLVMEVPGGVLSNHSYLLAVSSDGGLNWTFVDTAPFDSLEKIRQVFPDYNPELKIPEKQPPVFTKKE